MTRRFTVFGPFQNLLGVNPARHLKPFPITRAYDRKKYNFYCFQWN